MQMILLSPPSTSLQLPPAKLYRLFLQHLRFIPDPQVWSTLVPRFRKLLSTPGPSPMSTPEADFDRAMEIREWRRQKAMKKARKEFNRLRAAVACHPHAFARLLSESYGQRGASRWKRLETISEPYSSTVLKTPLPSILSPLRPPEPAPDETQPRARKTVPACRLRKMAERLIQRDWKYVKAPIYIPRLPPDTDNDAGRGKTIILNLRHLANLSERPEGLDLTCLPFSLQMIFPRNATRQLVLPLPPYPPPRPKATRSNPSTWKLPTKLDRRLMMRTYRRLWNSLVWVRPVGPASALGPQKWIKCRYEDILRWENDITFRDEVSVEEDKVRKMTKKGKVTARAASEMLDPIKWKSGTVNDFRWLSIQKQTSPDT
ncbi:uncharacterized protein L203_106160 [Cryptococcus depauperatus CBS 7841]|uniref:LYR motif-containing protein Cup1-like N-terminal domain-containing protein n=1 Tax=Cryptococcus depauperatus CBS 7841 TaxID=1295531 RepID=A0AAJ8M3W0_9TREE